VTRAERTWGAEDDRFLLDLRREGDPDADHAVAAHEVFDRRAVFGQGSADWIDGWFGDRRPRRPDWQDDDLLEVGQRFHRRQPLAVNVAFLLGSLPMSYCGSVGARVLTATGGLTERAQHRIFESALLIGELTEPGGLADGLDGRPLGHGYLTVLRLRLLHAAVRRTLAEGWDDAEGPPVNQLDLLGTLWCFALSSIDALEKAGREVLDEEREGWVHLWCVVGHHLGLRPDLLPMGRAEAERCFGAVQRHRFGPSAEGRELMKELIEVGHERVPFTAKDGLVEALVRRNLGDDYADMLGVERTDDADLRHAEWFWHLATREAAPDDLDDADDGRSRVARFLLWRFARQLRNDARPQPAKQRLLQQYGVSDLVDVPDRWEDVPDDFAPDPPDDPPGPPAGGAAGT
jgi:hypothetical protein